MQEELKQKEVLAMYDVRGIQSYIFGTNRIRDIIGASDLVENIIMSGIRKLCEVQNWPGTQYLCDWEEDNPEAFLKDENVRMQVLFVGGGNAYVLYRTGEICEKANRFLAKYILEQTYSLNLAVAVVEKTEDYNFDYEKINKEMRAIKAVMPQSKPIGAFPIMPVDSATGYPLTSYDKVAQEYVSTETKLKRRYWDRHKDEDPNKVLDDMVTQKGDNSMLAVVHIDGNGMGNRIKQIMQSKSDYLQAVSAMRQISKNLKYEFQTCYHQMCKAIDEKIADRVRANAKGRLYRKIIVAGDDITFICNAKVALFAVKTFLQCASEKQMFQDDTLTDLENKRKYSLSACAGVAFFPSHFPFSDAYEVAESCCSSAKRKAKLRERRNEGQNEGMIGNYVDFQICQHIKVTDLEKHREKNYIKSCVICDEKADTAANTRTDGKSMLYRPYYVSCKAYDDVFDLNKRNNEYDLENVLFQNLRIFQRDEIGQSKYKKLRNMFSYGDVEVDKEITFLRSRKTTLPDTVRASWYDALEIVSICEIGEEETIGGAKQ